MKIIKTKAYERDYKNKLVKKNKIDEINRETFIIRALKVNNNLYDALNDSYLKTRRFEKKKGNLKEFYTARLNDKIRIIMRPVGEYPYNTILIDEIVFEEVDDSHYGGE